MFGRASDWKQSSTDLMMQFPENYVITGDQFLDNLSPGPPAGVPNKLEICVSKFKRSGAKAKAATAAGDIFAARECYLQCETAVEEAGDGLSTSERQLLLLWVYHKLGRAFRLDVVDGLPKAIEYFSRCLSAMEAMEAIEADEDQLRSNIKFVQFIGIGPEVPLALDAEIMKTLSAVRAARLQLDRCILVTRTDIAEMIYERAHDISDDDSLDQEIRSRLIAEAVLNARTFLPELFDTQNSDWFVKDYMCMVLSETYERCGRLWKALRWNEERLKQLDKESNSSSENEFTVLYRRLLSRMENKQTIPVGELRFSTQPGYRPNLLMDVRLRSADLLQTLGEYEKAVKYFSFYKNKLKNVKVPPTESTETWRTLAYLPAVSSSKRNQLLLQNRRDNPESTDRPSMSDAAIRAEMAAEAKWREDFDKSRPTSEDTEYRFLKLLMQQNALADEAKKLMFEGKLMEAIARYKAIVEFSSVFAGESMARWFFRIGFCHAHILGKRSEPGAGEHSEPAGADEYSDTYHFNEAAKYIREALKLAEQVDDVYLMSDYNKHLGLLYYMKWLHGLCGVDKVGIDGHECLTEAVNFFQASGRNFCRFLYALPKNPDQLWVSILERQNDSESLRTTQSIHALLVGSIWDVFRLEFRLYRTGIFTQAQFMENQQKWLSQALLWAERGHSRTLAFKLSERNMGARTRSELQKFDLEDWREAWPSIIESRDVCGPGTVMVEFILADDYDRPDAKFFLFCVTQAGPNQMLLQFDPKEDLGELLKKLNHHMSQTKGAELAHEELIHILQLLYWAFFAPIQQILDSMEDHHKLIICANKILAGVPFAAFMNPKSGKFLIESHNVFCTPSLRILKQCDQRKQFLERRPLMESKGAALVMGDPAFSKASDRLKFTETEADTIAGVLGPQNVELLKGKDALKRNVLNWAQLATESGKYQALMHLATHGRVGDGTFQEGALEFADPKVQTWQPVPTPESTGSQQGHEMTSNLSLQSNEGSSSSTSVQASQAQEPTFHGRGHNQPRTSNRDVRYLRSEEIVKDYEWRMLLAVLSACETAKGVVKAEGTLNLARALLMSGVPCTVVSLWKVDDASTPILMEGLYKTLMSGEDVASALRAAMKAMIKDYRVHQWAPFVVMGLGTVKLPKQFRETHAVAPDKGSM